eukprot:c27315_g1_i2 orf=269-2275(-)
MDLTKPGPPISYPLTSLEELENRSYFSSFHFQFNKCSVPLPTLRTPSSHEMRPRLLVCHDMKGGYQDDKWIQGGSNSNAYSLWHWHLIDVFVYFSHSLVTLPPPCWTNAAHKHGVQVLGTFITEWKEGAAVCECLLSSKEASQMYASRLAELAASLGFDGWLINIENEVEQKQMEILKEFVNNLTVSMHSLVPGSLVIWYDSVTKDGNLDWQNCLNGMNKCFFDLCDGIFTNYTWKENFPKMCAEVAGGRRYDVYMGVDVFGRRTFGGGGFQCNVALKAAKEAGVSAALFAPGWVYETNQGPSFHAAQNRYWGLIADCWPSAQHYLLKFPFFSNFDQGYGKQICIAGRNVSTLPWNNISCQNIQPVLYSTTEPMDSYLDAIVSTDGIAFDGGACVKFSGGLGDKSHCLTMLYNGNAPANHRSLFVSYSVKAGSESGFCLLFRVHGHHGVRLIYLVDSDKSYDHPSGNDVPNIVFNIPFQSTVCQEWNIREYTISMADESLNGIYAVSFLHKLNHLMILDLLCKGNAEAIPATTNYTTPETTGTTAKSRMAYHTLLGNLRVTYSQGHNWFSHVAFQGHNPSWQEKSAGQKVVSVMLVWHVESFTSCSIERYYIYVGKNLQEKNRVLEEQVEYLGASMIEAFYAYELPVPPGCETLFTIGVKLDKGSILE